jgi:prolyl oligopeptidase
MRNSVVRLIPRALLPGLALCCLVPGLLAQEIKYPAAKKVDQFDLYHGVRVADPYRWLEDVDSPDTRAWIEAQNALSAAYLNAVPERAAIRKRLNDVWNFAKYSAPFKADGKYFYFENNGLQNQPVLFVMDGRDAKPKVLLDPNTLSSDGTVAITAQAASPNGKYLAYAVSKAGSDWREIRIREVGSRRDLADTLKWVKFSSMSWTHDNKGFFYSRYDEPEGGNAKSGVNQFQTLYYHRINSSQDQDEIIYEDSKHPDWGFNGEVNYDGQFLIISITKGTDVKNQILVVDLEDPGRPKINNPLVRVLEEFIGSFKFVGNGGHMLLFRTDYQAPNGRIIQIDLNFPRRDRWRTVVKESKDVMTGATVGGDLVVVSYLSDAHSVIHLYDPLSPAQRRGGRRPPPPPGGGQGGGGQVAVIDTVSRGASFFPRVGEITLPGIGTVEELNAQDGDSELFYSFASFLTPKTIYRFDVEKRTSSVFRAPTLKVDLTRFETRLAFTKSKDGTRVPVFVTARKDVTLDGNNPTLLHGYGGFNINVTPTFSPANIAWLEMGGVYAVATLRGGGEYGKTWHEGGMLDKKQNVFDDFVAAARYLIDAKYTAPAKLAITGASNGGLLVGAVMTQHPELFGAALPAVGVMDMLRFHKFTIGWAWTSDYGSPDDSTQFKYLYAYSPLHNIKPGMRYPATLVLTGDHDDRVVPGHSFKFAATLQAAQTGDAPVLIRIDTNAGHGVGKPTSKQIEEATDRLAFLVRSLNMRVSLP